jgi:hypothetical protein
MQFPIKGTYVQIRLFVEQILLTMPYASLDEIGFKRDAINNSQLDTTLTFSIYTGSHLSPAKDHVE